MPLEWNQLASPTSRTYVCGYCSNTVGPDRGYIGSYTDPIAPSVPSEVSILICSRCRQPTYFDPQGTQWPGAPFGTAVSALPTPVEVIYEEARRGMSISAFNTAVMACRKLLLHIAVERGAPENKTFAYYVDWLVENHYAPPGSDGWVKQIKDRGNDANHEIDLIDQHTAERILSFVELLLKFVYEMPARAGMPDPPTSGEVH